MVKNGILEGARRSGNGSFIPTFFLIINKSCQTMIEMV